ncbi:AI-2E family transporter [Synechococcus sp. FACHB-909]|uniref:AI-2E family transporter n=1 Tax=Synechococcus sp. FACHB-909 TaxID=2692863 RepID=UPI0018F01B65|nr:AI-2E family transporter [Synechococcus sp. FACHB-909]
MFSTTNLVRYLLLLACIGVTVVIFNYFSGTIAVFTAAAIVAALLNVPVKWLSRYLPRGWSIAAVTCGALILLIGFVTGIGLQVLNQGQGLLLDLQGTLKQQDLTPLHQYLKTYGFDRITTLLQEGLLTGLGLLQTVFSGVFTGIFGAVISLYMLIDGEKLWKGFLGLIPEPHRDRFAVIFLQSVLGFIRGQLLLMVFLTVSTAVIFPLLGVKYSLILAVIVGVLDAIPGIGATLGILLISLMVFASQGGDIGLRALIASVLLGQIQDNIVRPKVMGQAMELNPVLLFLALFIGQRVAGLLGVFLSIPLAGMLALWFHSERQRRESILLTPAVGDGTGEQGPSTAAR